MYLRTKLAVALLLAAVAVLTALKYAVTIGAVWYQDAWLWLTLACVCATIVAATLYLRAAERAHARSVVHPANLVRNRL